MISRPVVQLRPGRGLPVRAVNVQALAGGRMRFTCQRRNGHVMPDLDITLNLPGEHNVRNALAAIAVATELELPDEPIVAALAKFSGVGRRFQRYGELACQGGGQFTLIDDYGHHPVEMAAVIAAARGPSRAGAWCWPSSRTATPARATASRTSSRCWARPTRCC
jgi:UDP-N-acetylmuramate--alanine ligase